MIVMKFGGTSVESRQAIERVAGIVEARRAQDPVVVVSAMGKTTNKLLAIAAAAVAGKREEALDQLAALRDFHCRESSAVGAEIEGHFNELGELVRGLAVMGELTPRATDAISSYGERLSSIIVASVFRARGLNPVHLDSRKFIVTDHRHTQAAPIFSQTYERLAAVPPLAQDHVIVMGGFIASTEDGVTSTLGRGGSDYTASIVGAGIGAQEIQIWTDVNGMLTADPTILPGGHRVEVCSFAEAAELAYFGAKVLHPATVLPAIEKNIPVRILNSRRPEVEGTLIVAQAPPSADPIRSIACKKNITLVNIVSTRMLMAHGFLRRIFEVFDRFETPVDMLATSEVSVSMTIDNTSSLHAIRAELETFSEVSVESGQSIVCLVGENIRRSPGVAARIFSALKDVNVRMVSQGASLLNFSLVVAATDLLRAVESLHTEFFPLMKLAIIGYGKMGRLVEQLAPEYGFQLHARIDVHDDFEQAGGADVAIEFTIPEAVAENVEKIAAMKIPLVVGTTGWGQDLDRVRAAVGKNNSALVWSPNFSVGVNVFSRLVSEAARLLADQPGYGAWAWEIHHHTKKDAPSGTLIKLVNDMKAAGYTRNIDTSSNRAGAHPGTHEIGFDSAADTIVLRHTARSREGFARGALKAAQWIPGKTGVFKFEDVLFGAK